MKYNVEFREDQRIVAARAEGQWDMAIDNGMVHEILKMVDTHGATKVLLDIRELQFDLPMFQLFERVREMRDQRSQFGRVSARAAIVYSDTNPKIEEDMQFFQNTARNRGLPYRVFKDIEEAMDWLVGEQGQG